MWPFALRDANDSRSLLYSIGNRAAPGPALIEASRRPCASALFTIPDLRQAIAGSLDELTRPWKVSLGIWSVPLRNEISRSATSDRG